MSGNDRKSFEAALRLKPLDAEAMAGLIAELGLTGSAARNLEVCLRQTEADLEEYLYAAFPRSDRQQLRTEREVLVKRLRAVVNQLLTAPADLQEILPNGSLAAIGEMLDHDEILRVIGDKAPRYIRDQDGPEPRRAAGLQYGGPLLIHFLKRILEPMEAWQEENSRNKGGRPVDLRRRFIIERLARGAPSVIGSRASTAKEGPFVRLCSDVFGAYKLPITGIADVIADIVSDLARENEGQ